MSSLGYGMLTTAREEDPDTGSEGKSSGNGPSSVNRYVDATAALVPGEILALHAFIMEFSTDTVRTTAETVEVNPTQERFVTTFESPATLEWSFYGLILLTFFVYFLGRARVPRDRWEFLRLCIPPSAFVAWTMLQSTSAFNAAFPALQEAPRMTIALFLAVILGALATWLAGKANEAKPPVK